MADVVARRLSHGRQSSPLSTLILSQLNGDVCFVLRKETRITSRFLCIYFYLWIYYNGQMSSFLLMTLLRIFASLMITTPIEGGLWRHVIIFPHPISSHPIRRNNAASVSFAPRGFRSSLLARGSRLINTSVNDAVLRHVWRFYIFCILW